MESLERRLKAHAERLGFARLGIAAAAPAMGGARLIDWLEQGHQAGMAWMERDPSRRIDPTHFWPECRTLLVGLVSYGVGDRSDGGPEDVGPLEGRIARYARGEDYHTLLKAMLIRLGQALVSESPGTRFIPVVDTSAVLERAHAVAAGLGWFGKNAMLLNREEGSYTLLGCLLIDRELTPDQPSTAHCGSCTRCIDACPTAAIVGPGVVDSRRCISYLTIEHRGQIPEPLQPSMASWIFGCDICQEVCPWVRKTARRAEGSPVLGGGNSKIYLDGLLKDSQTQFAARWKGTPLKRPRREGLARNAAVVLGSSPDRDSAVEVLEAASQHDSPLVRVHVAQALAHQGGQRARKTLNQMLEVDPDPDVARAAERGLEQL